MFWVSLTDIFVLISFIQRRTLLSQGLSIKQTISGCLLDLETQIKNMAKS
jgi:hypothetical protein